MKEKDKQKGVFREYFESFVETLIIALFGMTFVVQAVTVPTASMQNTILVGDYLLVNKFIFPAGGDTVSFLPQREIQRGDIIVFKYPGNRVDPASDRRRGLVPYQISYVKRVIALPGETVEFRNNNVYINGELLPEHRITADMPVGVVDEDSSALQVKSEEPREPNQLWDVYYSSASMESARKGNLPVDPRMNFGVPGKVIKVPEDSYFVMGDNRDNSDDSRFWGFVHRDLIIGKAMFIYWSCDRNASDNTFLSCLLNPRLERIGKIIR
ncbi:MAG: signal peptidase I [Acidobacteriota bacterium]|nr:signal peptidase I [Acidobacteriota bacterium]